jgi:hypothetical protein
MGIEENAGTVWTIEITSLKISHGKTGKINTNLQILAPGIGFSDKYHLYSNFILMNRVKFTLQN